MMKSTAEILQEYGPFPDVEQVGGVTFDGHHVWFASGDRINALDPESGKTVRAIAVPAHAGTAFDGRHLFQIAEARIQKIDPETGKILRTIASDRFVTGVTWVDGELWHGTWENDESELRRIDPRTGEALESIEMPAGIGVSGLESDGGERFYCGGGSSGKVRAVRRPKRK
jgi:glutamine cyclotransferase